jgi:hypothetical protein
VDAFAVEGEAMNLSYWKDIPPRKRKLILWIIGCVLAYAVIGFLILPPIIRHVAVTQLSKQLDREVSIQQVKLNPFVLSVTVRGLLIKDKDGQPFVSWDEVYVNFQLSSFLGRAWVFKEISTTRPFIRVQMNKDGSFNFSDLITKFSSGAAPAKTPSKPLVLHVDRLHIGRAAAALADFTPREPFKRVLGPLDITLDNFRTDPDNKNPYSFSGTTDAGETIAWRGFFYLSPLRSQGRLTLYRFTLNKYAPLYQDLVRFQIRDGIIAIDVNYNFELSATNRVATVHDTDFALRDFKLGTPGDTNDLVDLPLLAVTGASADLQARQASVDSIKADGAKLFVQRNKDASINVIELSKPAESANAPGGILFLLRSVTNAVAMLLNSTNQWSGVVHSVSLTNCALHLEDLVNSRPATLDLTGVSLDAKNISNVPGTNLTAELAMRWNTNGSIKAAVTASFLPPTADLQLDLDQLDLGTLDPYLEPKLNLFILGSKLGLHGQVRLRTPKDALPEVTFHGDASLDDFRTVDGVAAEDLLKWDSLHFSDIDANLNPPTVNIRQIAVADAYARLIIETNHTINLLNALHPASPQAPATNETKVAAAQPPAGTNAALPQISIGAVAISNTVVSYSDRSLQPNVNMTIEEVNGTISGLSSEQLQRADLNLAAKVDGAGPVAITGSINPFSGTSTNQVTISVKDVDLTPASPYSGKYAGYEIAEGKLNLDLSYQLVGKSLQSSNVITLDQFTFGEKVDSPDATHLPVRLAIALLKDREGKIVLDVPIEGSLDDPKFRIGKVVWRVVGNILEKVATSPFSLLGALFGGGGEEMGWQDFAAGSAELTPADRQKLDSLAKGLFERPALRLEISGSIDPGGDREGLQRAALDHQIREQKWLKLSKAEQATNSVDQIVLTPDDRAHWVEKFYAKALSDGKITPQLIAANTNLAAYTAAFLSQPSALEKGALRQSQSTPAETTSTNAPVYQTKLSPPPTPMEALLLTTFPVADNDLETLAAARAQAVETYLLKTGKVEAARLFLKQAQANGIRSEGSRVYLQFE